MLGYGAFSLGGTSQARSLRLTQPTGWVPAIPAGMTHFRLSVVPGRTPEPSRSGMAGDSSAPLPSMFIDGFQSRNNGRFAAHYLQFQAE